MREEEGHAMPPPVVYDGVMRTTLVTRVVLK